jgi:hypothetical protein
VTSKFFSLHSFQSFTLSFNRASCSSFAIVSTSDHHKQEAPITRAR